MWTPGTWLTEEDVERDLLLLAEYSAPTPEEIDPTKNKVPDTILQYRRRMAQNKERTLNGDLDDGASYIVSGRGKGIRDRVIRPGGTVDIHPIDEALLKKQIRQVSGFGYSNEVIQQSIQATGYNPETDSDNSNSTFKFVSQSSSSSTKSSVESTPTKKKKGESRNDIGINDNDFPPLKEN